MGLLTAYAFSQRSEAQEQAALASAAKAEAENEAKAADAARAASQKSEQKAQAKERGCRDVGADREERAGGRSAPRRTEARRQTRIAQDERDEQRRLRIVADDARADAERPRGLRGSGEGRSGGLGERRRSWPRTTPSIRRRSARSPSSVRSRRRTGRRRARSSRGDLPPQHRPRAEPATRAAERADGIDARARGHLARRVDAMPAPAQCCRAGAGRSMRSRRARAEHLRPPSLSSGNGTVDALRTSADGTLVLVGGADGEARVFELATGRRLARLRPGAPLRDAVFTPDGKSVFTGDANGVIIRWDVRSGARLARAVHGAPIRELAVSPDGSLVASAAGEAARVWRASDGGHVIRLPHPLSVERRLLQLLRRAAPDPRTRRPALRHARLGARTDRARPAGTDPDRCLLPSRGSRRDRWPRRPGDDLGHPGRHPAAHARASRRRTRRRLVAERSPARHGERGQRWPCLSHRHRRALHVPGRALEPDRRRRLQPGRRVDRDRVP